MSAAFREIIVFTGGPFIDAFIWFAIAVVSEFVSCLGPRAKGGSFLKNILGILTAIIIPLFALVACITNIVIGLRG